ncbi:fluoride efflux transporter CrcB [Gordonia sp. NPDC003425]
MIVVAMLIAGALGALARFVVDGSVKRWRSTTFPFATVGINLSGSFLLGVLAGLVIYHAIPAEVQTVVGTGFCGGFTTFSTASFESVRLAQQRRSLMFVVNVAGTLVGSVAACALGLVLAWTI